MAKTAQIPVTAESKPGVLAKVCDALGKAGVNILAVCTAESAGRGKIRLVVSDPARAKEALGAAKIRCGEEPALLLSLEDRPGALAGVASRLAAAKINACDETLANRVASEGEDDRDCYGHNKED